MKRFSIILLLLFVSLSVALAQSGEEELADKYFQDGEFESALTLYTKLQKKDARRRLFNLRIADCYRQLERYEQAISFLDKAIKKNPLEHMYPFVQADLYKLTGDFKKAEALETQVIEKGMRTDQEFMEIGTWLYQGGKTELALRTYLQGRKTLRSKYIFGAEIANLYALQGEYGQAAEEHLGQYLANPAILNSVKTSILNLVDDRSAEAVEQVLLAAVNRKSNDLGLRSMLFEFYVLTENFYEAFVQCKSIDKVFKENGNRVYKFALTLRNNKKYRLSNKALDYIIDQHDKSAYFLKAYQEKTVNGELQAFETLPLDTAALREAVVAYDALLDKFGRKGQFFDAMYRKANLMAFYLFDLEGALAELARIDAIQIQHRQRAKADLLIGDVLLMQKEYNKAKLKYNDVAEKFHEGQIGAMAKFKQGRLSYFKGDFEYAKARLKTIKDNTSNDISNDAIKLFLTIQDNSGLDTTTYPLQRFAQAQLMVFQRDFDPALQLLDSLMYAYPSHGLVDEILWEKANIFITQNDVEKGLTLLEKIIVDYGEDIHGDDALYTKAKIHDYTLGNKEKAMEYYIEFLKNYSGSLYIVEVRKRIRALRNERM